MAGLSPLHVGYVILGVLIALILLIFIVLLKKIKSLRHAIIPHAVRKRMYVGLAGCLAPCLSVSLGALLLQD
jgi:hypothetical protein